MISRVFNGVQLLVSTLGGAWGKMTRDSNVPFMASAKDLMRVTRVTWPDMKLFLKI